MREGVFISGFELSVVVLCVFSGLVGGSLSGFSFSCHFLLYSVEVEVGSLCLQ